MPALSSFDYAVIRVVPRVERQEFVNAGVIVLCLEQRYLRARVHVDEERLLALWPHIDIEDIRQRLQAFPNICDGNPEAGPIAQLPIRERFHWLVAPRSTVIQVSPVHSGLCETPEGLVERLFEQFVTVPQIHS